MNVDIKKLEAIKEELEALEEDDVLCDEDDNRLDEREDYIGPGALATFGIITANGPDDIYVINRFMEKAFHVRRIHDAYGRIVQGLDEDYENYHT